MKQSELDIILENHKKWLYDNNIGKRADLRSADLRSADLSDADLRYADLSYADLSSANLSSANFTDKEILAMDGKTALKFWKKWKPILKLIMGYEK